MKTTLNWIGFLCVLCCANNCILCCANNRYCADQCLVFKLKLRKTPLRRFLDSKYTNYALNIVDNNRSPVESLQKGNEWVRQFVSIVDQVLPILVCSIATRYHHILVRQARLVMLSARQWSWFYRMRRLFSLVDYSLCLSLL